MPKYREDIKTRMREAVGAKTDLELAQRLGRSHSSVAEWKSRRSIPKHAVDMAALISGTSAQWILTGEEDAPSGRVHDQQPIYVLNRAAGDVAARINEDPEAARWCLMLLRVMERDPDKAEWLKGNILMFADALDIEGVDLCLRYLRKPPRRKRKAAR